MATVRHRCLHHPPSNGRIHAFTVLWSPPTLRQAWRRPAVLLPADTERSWSITQRKHAEGRGLPVYFNEVALTFSCFMCLSSLSSRYERRLWMRDWKGLDSFFTATFCRKTTSYAELQRENTIQGNQAIISGFMREYANISCLLL